MTLDEYNALTAINWSKLRHARTSMLAYKHALDNPMDDTPRFGIGRAIHSAILEPEKLTTEYAVFDGARRAGKAWDAFEEANAGKTILKANEWSAIQRAADAVRNHGVAREWLNLDFALVERPITWIDPFTKLACKSRPDCVHSAIVEVKSTDTVDERAFLRKAANLGYFGQKAFQRRGIHALTKMWLPCAIVAVEVEAPHDVGVFLVDEDSLRVADAEITKLLTRVAECQESGKWPGRYDTARPLVLPPWAREPEDFDFDDVEAA